MINWHWKSRLLAGKLLLQYIETVSLESSNIEILKVYNPTTMAGSVSLKRAGFLETESQKSSISIKPSLVKHNAIIYDIYGSSLCCRVGEPSRGGESQAINTQYA